MIFTIYVCGSQLTGIIFLTHGVERMGRPRPSCRVDPVCGGPKLEYGKCRKSDLFHGIFIPNLWVSV